ncbi:hypothetical protein H0I58_20985 [Yersinia enterocolitica]|nr:hypothetical protein [Yersinia enterocolitica]
MMNAPYRSYQGAGKARQQANSTRPCHQTSDPVTTFQLPESSMAIAMATISQVGDFYSDPVQKSQMSLFAASLPLGPAGHAVLACGGMVLSGRPLKQEPTETSQAQV